MKRGMALALAVVLAAAPAAALAAGGGSAHVYVTDCAQAKYKPKTIVISCGDGSRLVEKLKWSQWSTTAASGTGTYAVNPCQPTCVKGHFKTYAVAVRLSAPGSCHKRKVFKTMTLRYTHRHAKSQRVDLGCPEQAPPGSY